MGVHFHVQFEHYNSFSTLGVIKKTVRLKMVKFALMISLTFVLAVNGVPVNIEREDDAMLERNVMEISNNGGGMTIRRNFDKLTPIFLTEDQCDDYVKTKLCTTTGGIFTPSCVAPKTEELDCPQYGRRRNLDGDDLAIRRPPSGPPEMLHPIFLTEDQCDDYVKTKLCTTRGGIFTPSCVAPKTEELDCPQYD